MISSLCFLASVQITRNNEKIKTRQKWRFCIVLAIVVVDDSASSSWNRKHKKSAHSPRRRGSERKTILWILYSTVFGAYLNSTNSPMTIKFKLKPHKKRISITFSIFKIFNFYHFTLKKK